ncbi:MAG: DNA polymerase/3'-5' exonuclease PolX [Patescibacteria group bacterium]|nr:DNA polymerase/3'-5' exonuclease PolX [Patescibacteria group bacterium]
MENREIARILKEIGEYLETDDIPFKPRAYEKAAEAIGEMEEEVSEVYAKGGIKAVEEIPGVGVSIANKIEELLKTGKLRYYERLKKKTPVDFGSFAGLEGVGPKSIKKLYKKLGVRNINDLKKAAKAGKIRKLEGFGKKSEEKILSGLEFVSRSGGRFLLGDALPLAESIKEKLAVLREVKKIEIAGSLRRRKETIGDIDILAVADNSKPVMSRFVSLPEVAKVLAHGETKSSVKLSNGIDVDLRVVPDKSYGAALNYFTGSKDHNVALREMAVKRGWKLNEYGLFDKKGKQIAGKTEEDLYKAFGLQYIEPELRENTGEIEAARNNNLPKIIGYKDLLGDLQVQTNWTDGSSSIEEMAVSAAKLGLRYIAITDHTKRLAMARGLDEKRLADQGKEIDRVNLKLKKKGVNIKILKGTECDILKDGSLDLKDEALAKLDIVGAATHSYFNLSLEEQTKRLMKAMSNPHVDIVFHPTGRLINRRPPYLIDIDEIVSFAKKTGTALEVDSLPDRLDIKDEYVRKCVQSGVKIAVDSDAHAIAHLELLPYGIAQARRGWAGKKDVVNSWPLEKMLKLLKR